MLTDKQEVALRLFTAHIRTGVFNPTDLRQSFKYFGTAADIFFEETAPKIPEVNPLQAIAENLTEIIELLDRISNNTEAIDTLNDIQSNLEGIQELTDRLGENNHLISDLITKKEDDGSIPFDDNDDLVDLENLDDFEY